MFETICQQVGSDADYGERVRRLDILQRVLEGRLYDVLPYEFHEERGAGGEYIPLRQRRPSVRYPLARIVVDDSVSLLFGDGHFPAIDCTEPRVRTVLGDLARETGLNSVMLEAARAGSVGSVVIWMRVLRGRVFFRVLDTKYLAPEWDPQEPDRLLRVTERYKVRGNVLAQRGYPDCEPVALYWFVRSWDDDAESWYLPMPTGQANRVPEIDPARSVRHGLGFVPLTWIRNLPGCVATSDDCIDGACTFAAAVETSIEIDYQLSQAGRGLKYSSDPLLLIREPAAPDGEMIRGGGNALVVGQGGDAKLLEIGGTASQAVIDYVRTLREYALEGVHGNRASADRLSAAQSGRALELMNQGLIWLADRLRVSYGAGLLQLASMVVQASHAFPLRVQGSTIEPLETTARLSLKWPRWTTPNAEDRARDAQTLSALTQAGLLSHETAIKSIADVYDIEDVPDELARISKQGERMSDEASADERVAALERQLAELQAGHRAALLRAALRAEATRAGMVDLDGLKLVEAGDLTIDDDGEVVGGVALMTSLKRAKPWLFGLPGVSAASSSSIAAAPPAQPPKHRRASEMTHDEWQTARAELLRRL